MHCCRSRSMWTGSPSSRPAWRVARALTPDRHALSTDRRGKPSIQAGGRDGAPDRRPHPRRARAGRWLLLGVGLRLGGVLLRLGAGLLGVGPRLLHLFGGVVVRFARLLDRLALLLHLLAGLFLGFVVGLIAGVLDGLALLLHLLALGLLGVGFLLFGVSLLLHLVAGLAGRALSSSGRCRRPRERAAERERLHKGPDTGSLRCLRH